MENRFVTSAVVALLLLPSWSNAQNMPPFDSAQRSVTDLVAKLEHSEVGRVEILSIPARIMTRIGITPEGIEKSFHYKLTIRDLRGGLYQEQLTKAVKTVSLAPQERPADLRWALIFYDVAGVRVVGFYFDANGHLGSVDETPVFFRGDLFEWLDTHFAKAMP